MKKRTYFLVCMFTTFMTLFVLQNTKMVSAEIITKKVTISTEENTNLKVPKTNKKVKWSSSNNKIASIVKIYGKNNRTVLVSGNKTGKCVMKAKSGKNTYKWKVTVKFGTLTRQYNGKESKVSVTKVQKNDSGVSIRVKMTNGTRKELWYGPMYHIEKYENGKWIQFEMKDNVAFNAVAYSFPANTAITREIHLSFCCYKRIFTSGKYRVYVDVNYKKEGSKYAEFEI